MPVSVVCESASANVNAALRESLGSGTDSLSSISGGSGNTQSLQDKLVASAKRVLLSRIEYEEVENYSQSILDTLKSKYIVLKPTSSNSVTEYEEVLKPTTSSSSGCNKSMNNSDLNQKNAPITAPSDNKKNPNEFPQPKRVLYQRENVRIGWKNHLRKWQVGVGMMNVGNTCYLNSTLQALFHVPSMANWLLSDSAHMEKCETENSNCIICAVAKTLQASQSSQTAIRPYFVYSKLKSICRHMNMGWQEDAHEFLRYLVESMEKSFLSRFRNFKELDQHSKETTPLNQILGGYLKSAVRCLSCGHVSTTFQHFQDLLLDIRKVDTIEEALDAYFSRERLEDMGYKCESCKKKVSATKQFSLERAPIALCIQLKRFSVLGTKLNKQISIRPRLDLSKFVSRKCINETLTYKLVAMITHLGASQHCGHYTAIGLTESGTYYSFDDSYVRPISIQNVCNTNAYIIFYEMDTTPAKQPTSTVISGKINQDHSKENGNRNSYAVSSTTTATGLTASNLNSKAPIKQQNETAKMIGPQLPPNNTPYTNGYPSSTTNNKLLNSNSTPTVLQQQQQQQTSKLSTNRQNCIPTSSSKIMIHFKNANSNTTATNTTSKCTISEATNSTLNAVTSTNNYSSTVSSQFQDSTNANNWKVSPSAHDKINCNESFDNGDNCDSKVSSTENDVTTSGTPLPSMPNLGAVSPTNSHQKLDRSSNSVVARSTEVAATSQVTTTTTTSTVHSCISKSPLKSLVPYESESDDEDDNNEASPLNADNDDSTKNKITVPTTSNASKGTIVTSATSSKQQLQSSKAKHKTDIIDTIFNAKRNNNNNKNNSTISSSCKSSNENISNNNKSSIQSGTPSKKLKLMYNDDENESSCTSSNVVTTGFKRAKSTPPSPPVIKTKTGIWQVTPITEADSTPVKKIKNPFATQKSNQTNLSFNSRRPAKSANEKRFSVNGYSKSSNAEKFNNSNNTVSELLKQSHRGYGGATVLSWNGNKSEMDKEITEETRLQRKRDWEEEDKTEMDRGRQKKIKLHNGKNNSSMNNPGYNPFQEQQRQINNECRWKGANGVNNGTSGGGYHYKKSNFCSGNNFHNNYKKGSYNGGFKRFNNNKFHNRHHHQRNSGDFHR